MVIPLSTQPCHTAANPAHIRHTARTATSGHIFRFSLRDYKGNEKRYMQYPFKHFYTNKPAVTSSRVRCISLCLSDRLK